MGIILLSLAIMPALGVGGMQMFKAEVPGPTPERLRPRIRETARLLWVTYLIFSAAEAVLLYLGDMSLYDAVAHTFTTMATGGFSTRTASIGAFDSVYVDTVVTVFMFLAGANFVLHYRALTGKPKAYFRDTEFIFYVAVLLVAAVIITLQIGIDIYGSFARAFRHAIFQVVSLTTTTGYVTADYEKWSFLSQLLLFILIFMGGCAGSTGGGIKQARMLMFVKQSYHELYKLVHPKAVISMKMSGNPVPAEVIHGAMGFFLIYTGSFLAASLVISGLGYDLVSSMGAVAATLGNVGPGFGLVGPTDNYAHLPLLGKWVLTVSMLMGRLEIYTVLVLFTAAYWRQ
jgi:trk system potassium uptake protein TrkH